MKLFSKYFFINLIILIYSSHSWSAESLQSISGVMEEQNADSFFLQDPDEDCEISIKRRYLDDTWDDFISANWNQGEVLRIALPAQAVSTLCDTEEIEEATQVAFDDSAKARPSSPLMNCDSSEYQSLKARVDDYNSKSTDGSSMDLPSCYGNDDSLPFCDSEEYQREEKRALAAGDPISPCKQRKVTEELRRGTR